MSIQSIINPLMSAQNYEVITMHKMRFETSALTGGFVGFKFGWLKSSSFKWKYQGKTSYVFTHLIWIEIVKYIIGCLKLALLLLD